MIGLAAGACREDSFARYRLKASTTELLPEFNGAKSYRSLSDTIELSMLLQGDYYEETGLPSPIQASEVDKVERQIMTSIATTSPLTQLIEYHLESVPNASEKVGSYDLISVRLTGENNLILAELRLENRDSIACSSPECRYADTLSIDSVEYYEVYYLADDPLKANIFINKDEGVVAFRDDQQKTYQRIK